MKINTAPPKPPPKSKYKREYPTAANIGAIAIVARIVIWFLLSSFLTIITSAPVYCLVHARRKNPEMSSKNAEFDDRPMNKWAQSARFQPKSGKMQRGTTGWRGGGSYRPQRPDPEGECDGLTEGVGAEGAGAPRTAGGLKLCAGGDTVWGVTCTGLSTLGDGAGLF